jgi:hypothetical protein
MESKMSSKIDGDNLKGECSRAQTKSVEQSIIIKNSKKTIGLRPKWRKPNNKYTKHTKYLQEGRYQIYILLRQDSWRRAIYVEMICYSS